MPAARGGGSLNHSLHLQDGPLEFYKERFGGGESMQESRQRAHDHESGLVCGQPMIVGREGHMWDVVF